MTENSETVPPTVSDRVATNATAISQLQSSMETNHKQLLDLLSNRPSVNLSTSIEGESPVKRPKLEFSETLAQVWEKTPTEAGIKFEGNRKRYESLWSLREYVVKLDSLVNVDPESVDPQSVCDTVKDLKIALADQLRMVRLATDRQPVGLMWMLIEPTI